MGLATRAETVLCPPGVSSNLFLVSLAFVLSAQPEAPPASAPSAAASDKPEEAAAPRPETLESLKARVAALELDAQVAEGRVAVVREALFSGVAPKTRAFIVHQEELGAAYELERAAFTMDGGVLATRENLEGRGDDPEQLVLYDGPTTPGRHELRVSLTYRGAALGPFTYLRGYRFKVESKYAFEVADGKVTTVRIVSHERSDITVQPTDRLTVRYDVVVGEGAASAPAAAPRP